MVSCGTPCGGTAHNLGTYQPMIRAVRPMQERHVRWRRRAAAVRHLALLHRERSFPLAGEATAAGEAIMRVAELPEDLIKHVLLYL